MTSHPGATLMYWKLAIWKAFAGSIVVVFGMAPSCVLNWDTMTTAGRIVAVGGVIVGLVKFLDALCDETVSRLAAGKTPVPVNGLGEEKAKPAGLLGVVALVLLVPLLSLSLFAKKSNPPPDVPRVALSR